MNEILLELNAILFRAYNYLRVSCRTDVFYTELTDTGIPPFRHKPFLEHQTSVSTLFVSIISTYPPLHPGFEF